MDSIELHSVGMPLPSPQRRTVLVINTGGRVGMMTTKNGTFVAKPGYLATQMHVMSDFQQQSMPHFEVIEMQHVDQSSEWTPEDWVSLAEEIYRTYYDYDGFVVVHGTDTMHYTATALSFMFHNLAKPIVFTGAMVPLEASFNDARRNLVSAMMFAAHHEICEVCIYFNDVLLRANRSLLQRSTMDAFESPNLPPLAVFGHEGFTLNAALFRRQPLGPLSLEAMISNRVVHLVLTPNTNVESIIAACFPQSGAKFDCLVLEVFGFGSMDSPLANALRHLARAASRCQSLLVVTPPWPVLGQTPPGLEALDPALVSVGDMLSECAVVKAMHLLGRGTRISDVPLLMRRNLRGEVTEAVSKPKL